MSTSPPGNKQDDAPGTDPEAAEVRAAKGSVHEAIGKLIGDDAAAAHGAAEKRAGAKDAPDPKPIPRR